MTSITQHPAHHLLGETLKDGWRITQKMPPTGSGGVFSVGYAAEKGDARCFVKVLDYAAIFRIPDDFDSVPRKMEQVTSAFNYEVDLLRSCQSTQVKRVIQIMGDGLLRKERFQYPDVSYILFERADGDLRSVDPHTTWDNALSMRALHRIAGGIRELHRELISHRDMKPSNILVMDRGNPVTSIKIGDLGHAEITGKKHPLVKTEKEAGDPAYKPPEMLYRSGYAPLKFDIDFYLLGSMALFLLMGQGTTPLLLQKLPYNRTPQQWQGTFQEILPGLEMAFGDILDNLEEKAPQDLLTVQGNSASDLISLVKELCHPNPERRGDKRHLKKFDAGRYESIFDRLATSFERRLIE